MSHAQDAVTRIDEKLAEYKAIVTLLKAASDRAQQNADYVRTLGLPILGKKVKGDKREMVRDYFDGVERSMFDQYLVGMVSILERWAFTHLPNAIGEARRAVGSAYDAKIVFARGAENFVRDKFNNLVDIDPFLRVYCVDQVEAVTELRDHRNFVAHGYRSDVGKPSAFAKLDDVAAVLKDVLIRLAVVEE